MFVTEKRSGEPQATVHTARALLEHAVQILIASVWCKGPPSLVLDQHCGLTAIQMAENWMENGISVYSRSVRRQAHVAIMSVVTRRNKYYHALPDLNDDPIVTFTDLLHVFHEAMAITDRCPVEYDLTEAELMDGQNCFNDLLVQPVSFADVLEKIRKFERDKIVAAPPRRPPAYIVSQSNGVSRELMNA